MTWQEAADMVALGSQEETDEIETIECFRRSQSVESIKSGSSPDSLSLAPELSWVQPLLRMLEKHVDVGALPKIKIASCCSGTLAEASVMKDWVLGGCGCVCCVVCDVSGGVSPSPEPLAHNSYDGSPATRNPHDRHWGSSLKS